MDSYSEDDLDQYPVQLDVVGITLWSDGPSWSNSSMRTTHGVIPFNITPAHDEDPMFSVLLLDPLSAAITSYHTERAARDGQLCEDPKLKLEPTKTYPLTDTLLLLVRLLYCFIPCLHGNINE